MHVQTFERRFWLGAFPANPVQVLLQLQLVVYGFDSTDVHSVEGREADKESVFQAVRPQSDDARSGASASKVDDESRGEERAIDHKPRKSFQG